MEKIGLFCVEYRLGFRTDLVFFYALSAQAAVDLFRADHSEPIVVVYRMEEVGGWQ